MTRFTFIVLFLFSTLNIFAQLPNDCVNAIVVCGNGTFSSNATGFGVQEVAGCSGFEHNSIWIKINIVRTGTLGFNLIPNDPSITVDYDFWVFGPNRVCSNLGSPIRCSTTNPQLAGLTSNVTGMVGTTTSTTAGPGANGNGFVRWLDVIAGQSYYIAIDRPVGDGGFDLEWTGSTIDAGGAFATPPVANSIPDLRTCSTTPNVGIFDLNSARAQINPDLTNNTITFHTSFANASDGISPLPNIYANTSNPQIIYAKVVNNTSGCSSITSFQLRVLPVPDAIMTASSTNVCAGDNVTISFNGTPDAVVEYTVDGGPIQFATLDNTGVFQITTQITITTVYRLVRVKTLDSDNITTLCSRNKNITVTINSSNTVVPIISTAPPTCSADGFSTISNYDGTLTYTFSPAGPTVGAGGLISGMTFGTSYTVTAGNATCSSVNSAPFTNVATLSVPVVPTINVTTPTCSADGYVTITNYDNTLIYSFTPAGPTVAAGGVVSGTTFGTSYVVNASNGSCSSVDSSSFTVNSMLVTPAVPTITATAPTCSASGFSTISNYDGTVTYTFTPAGPTVAAGGLISGMTVGTSYTVTAGNATCTSVASASFSTAAMLATPAVPTINVTTPTCSADGYVTITNYDNTLIYSFTPAGPTIGAGGVVSGVTFGTSYTVTAGNGSCTSVASASFTVNSILITPAVPTITATAPTCSADGFSSITNYDGTLTYTFTPAGPTVGAGGLVSGMTIGTSYMVTAGNGTCTSVASASFSNGAMLATPAVPTINVTTPTCLANGFATITNYNSALTYTFSPTGPTVGAGGLVSGMTIGTPYTVTAGNGSCISGQSSSFSISQQLPQPTIVSVTNNGPICVNGTATFTINATSNTQVSYSVNGNAAQIVAINASGVGVVSVTEVTGSTTLSTISVSDGICSSNVVLSSTVTLFPNTTIALTSAPGTDNQSRCAGVTIDPIQYQVTGIATNVVVTGLPAGVTSSYNAATGLVTISGSANNGGAYNYTVTTSGGCNPQAVASGSITVTGRPVLNYTVTRTVCDGSTLDFVLNSNLPGTTYTWSATVSNITGDYSVTTSGTEANINQVATLNNDETIGTISMIIIPNANGCDGVPETVLITVNPNPVIESVTVTDNLICSGSNVHVDIVGNISGITYAWTAIISGVNVVGGTTSGTITATSTTTGFDLQIVTSNSLVAGTIYFQVSSIRNGCVGNTMQSEVITVNPNPGLPIPSPIKTICSGESADLIVDVSPLIAGTDLTWEVLTVVNVSGATPGTGVAPVTINDILTTNSQGAYVIYRVSSNFGECEGGYTDYRVNVNPAPLPILTNGNICITASGEVYQTYTLNTGLNNADYDFEWFDSNGDIIPGATSSTLVVDEAGTYSVIATNWLTGCSSDPTLGTATAIVTETMPATSMTVVQSEYFSDNATITITVPDGIGALLYQLDEGVFQSSNVFTGVSAGEHMVTVIDSEGCTYLTQEVTIIDYPNYFTPNGDGINDTWNISGLNQPEAKLYIFDRYGKLLKQLSATEGSDGWDGTYNQEQFPSTDYWFTLDYMENGVAKTFKAHFSLKR